MTNPILERAEIYFAESAREMLAAGQYVTPHYLGHAFFDKPILAYWAVAASFRVLGVSRLAARVPSMVAALLTILLTAFGVARMAGRKAGLAAASILCSSYMFFYQATLSMSDMWLTLFCAATSALLFAGNRDAGRRTLFWWLASVSSGLAVLTKGPIGVVLPVAAFLVYLMVSGELRQIRLRHVAIGAATVTVVAGAWFAWLWRANGSSSMYAFFIVENLRRFTGASYETRRSITYVPLALIGDFLPWAAFLTLALWRRMREPRTFSDTLESRGELLLWCYVGVITGFFWLSRFQLEYYLLPVIPACAALVGAYLVRALKEDDRPVRIVASAVGGVILAAGAAALYLAFFAGRPAWHEMWMPSVWLFLCGAAMLLFLIRGRTEWALATLAIAVCAGLALGSRAQLPLYERALGISDLVHATQETGASGPLAVSAELDGWRGELAFRTAGVPLVLDTPEDFARFLRGPETHAAIVSDGWIQTLPADLSGRVRVVFRGPVLMRKVTRAALLDGAALDRDRERFALVISDSSATAPK